MPLNIFIQRRASNNPKGSCKSPDWEIKGAKEISYHHLTGVTRWSILLPQHNTTVNIVSMKISELHDSE